jgi:hypothetical protein
MSTTSDPVVPITVTVTRDIHGNPHVNCSPATATVSQANTTLQFTLTTSGWVFQTATPVYLVNPPDPNFPNAPVLVSSTQVTWLDTLASAGDINYVACVQSTADGTQLSHDPVIHNTVSL